MILGHSLINAMRAIISPGYLLMKFPTPQEVGQVRGNQKQTRVCYVGSTKGTKGKEKSMTEETSMINEQKLKTNKPQLVESLEAISLSPDADNQQVRVGSQLEGPEKEEVVRCLRAYADICLDFR